MLKLVMFVVTKRDEIQNTKLETHPLIAARTIFWTCVPTAFPQRPDRFWDPPSLVSDGYLKLAGHITDHSLPSDAEVKNQWSYTSTSPTRLYGVHRDN
jgi:hypothetical protein